MREINNNVIFSPGVFEVSFKKEHDKFQLLWKLKGKAQTCYTCSCRHPFCRERQYEIEYTGSDLRYPSNLRTTSDIKESNLVCKNWYKGR